MLTFSINYILICFINGKDKKVFWSSSLHTTQRKTRNLAFLHGKMPSSVKQESLQVEMPRTAKREKNLQRTCQQKSEA